MWPRICPVCRRELPERGNRRVYVSWKRGFRLVHAGECFDAIDAQAVLELEQRQEPLDPVVLVRARTRAQAMLERHTALEHTSEELTAIACRWVARLDQQLVRDESPEQLERLHQHALNFVKRVLVHGREVCGPTRMEVL